MLCDLIKKTKRNVRFQISIHRRVLAAIEFDEECPSLTNASSLQQSQLIQRLTHVCRYDRLERPIGK